MSPWLTAVLCGMAGVIVAHITYVQANLFIHGDVTRLHRHPLFDPLAFDGLALLWGLAVGGLVGALPGDASPGKALLIGLGVTLLGVAVVGGVSTWKRYLALPSEPRLKGGPVDLVFELRLPSGRSPNQLPEQGQMGSGPRRTTHVRLHIGEIRTIDGRLVLPGRVKVRFAETGRLLQFYDPQFSWVPFTLPLSEIPGVADSPWSDWQLPENADPSSPPGAEFELRYRVQLKKGR